MTYKLRNVISIVSGSVWKDSVVDVRDNVGKLVKVGHPQRPVDNDTVVVYSAARSIQGYHV